MTVAAKHRAGRPHRPALPAGKLARVAAGKVRPKVDLAPAVVRRAEVWAARAGLTRNEALARAVAAGLPLLDGGEKIDVTPIEGA